MRSVNSLLFFTLFIFLIDLWESFVTVFFCGGSYSLMILYVLINLFPSYLSGLLLFTSDFFRSSFKLLVDVLKSIFLVDLLKSLLVFKLLVDLPRELYLSSFLGVVDGSSLTFDCVRFKFVDDLLSPLVLEEITLESFLGTFYASFLFDILLNISFFTPGDGATTVFSEGRLLLITVLCYGFTYFPKTPAEGVTSSSPGASTGTFLIVSVVFVDDPQPITTL